MTYVKVYTCHRQHGFRFDNKLFVSSEGSRINQKFTRAAAGIVANATGSDDRQRRSYPSSFGGQWELAGWELIERLDLPGNAQKAAEKCVALLNAPACPNGCRCNSRFLATGFANSRKLPAAHGLTGLWGRK